jgi:hypothetical protein
VITNRIQIKIQDLDEKFSKDRDILEKKITTRNLGNKRPICQKKKKISIGGTTRLDQMKEKNIRDGR